MAEQDAVWPAIYEFTDGMLPRIVFAPERLTLVSTILGLTAAWEGRFRLTYVLLQAGPDPFDAGRYDYHGTLDRTAIERFFAQHGDFIAADGRHALWLSTGDARSLLGYDRYGLLTLMGDVAPLRQRLEEQGLTPGYFDLRPQLRRPVLAENDDALRHLMRSWKWLQRPLSIHDSI